MVQAEDVTAVPGLDKEKGDITANPYAITIKRKGV